MTVHFSLYIFTLGDRWECVRGEKCETQLAADTHWAAYTHFPSHLDRDLRTPHADRCPSSAQAPQPPSPTPVFSLFPLFSHGVTSFFSSFPFSDNHYRTNLFLLHIFLKTFKHISVGKKAGEINFIKNNTAD